MPKKKVNQLSDITVEKVGLVALGANQETFFLLKSVDEELPMSDTEQVVEGQVELAGDEIHEDSLVEKIVAGVKKLLGAEDVDPEIDSNELETESAEPLAEEGAVESSESGDEHVAESDVVDSEVVEKIDALQKANLDLLERLEKAEAALGEKNEAVEKQVFVAKAAEFRCVPVAQNILSEQLYKLDKADHDLFGFWSNLLTAMDKSLSDAGLFTESGTTEEVATDADELIKKAVETGNFDELKKLMLGLDQTSADRIIDSRRVKSKSRVREQ